MDPASITSELGEGGSGQQTGRKTQRLRDAFRVQSMVIWALVLREMRTRFGKHQLGYLWAVLEPFIHVLLWVLVINMIQQHRIEWGMNNIERAATGILPFFLAWRTADFVANSITSNQALLQYSRVRHVDLMLARFLLESMTMIFAIILIGLALIVPGYISGPDDLMAIYPPVFCLLFLGFGFGVFNSVVMVLAPTYQKCIGFSMRIFYFTSGLFFFAESMPPKVIAAISWNPILHGVELVRTGYSEAYQTSFASHGYILGCGLVLLAFGLASERIFREKLQDI